MKKTKFIYRWWVIAICFFKLCSHTGWDSALGFENP